MSDRSRGTLGAALAYLLWGVFPLYFRLLDRSGALEILLHRIAWSLVVCALLCTALRCGGRLRALLRRRRTVLLLSAAAVAIAVNWGVYIYTANSAHVLQAALGYYVNPIVTVLLGVVVLGERIRPVQWAALATGAAAVVVLTLEVGRPPWLALTLAASFGSYGLLKNRVGGEVPALIGLTTETLVLLPAALVGIAVLEVTGHGHVTTDAPVQGLLLASTGVVTVAPLLLFADAAGRVPLSVMGLLQYLTPTLQLLCAVLVLGEEMPPARWAGFGLVWLALLMLAVDGLRAGRRTAREARRAREAAVEAPAG